MLTALRVIDIWTAITLLSPPSGLSAACLQTATFLKVLGIDSKVFRQRGWSVLSPGRVTQHHWPGGETPNHWFSHLRSWVWKTHNLSRHIYKVRRKNRAATSVLYWSPRLGESVRMSKRLLLAAKPKGKRVRSAERLGEHPATPTRHCRRGAVRTKKLLYLPRGKCQKPRLRSATQATSQVFRQRLQPIKSSLCLSGEPNWGERGLPIVLILKMWSRDWSHTTNPAATLFWDSTARGTTIQHLRPRKSL